MGKGNARGMGKGADHGSSEVAQVMDVDHPVGTICDISTSV
jgi:hypothetical protein